MCGCLTNRDVLPAATAGLAHYEKRFADIDADDARAYNRNLGAEARTATRTAQELASKLVKDAKTISGPIANDVARFSENHLATVFTMVANAGLLGFVPDVEGPAQSRYNELHCHVATSAFTFLSTSDVILGLGVNKEYARNTLFLNQVYDNFIYGTLTQKTKMERHAPGSLDKSLTRGVKSTARGRVSPSLIVFNYYLIFLLSSPPLDLR